MLVYLLQLQTKLFASNSEPMVIRKDALAQGADGLGLMKNEDHQVLGNEQKLEKDASDYTKVDDDGVEFSPEGGGYFPIMGDETKKDKCYIFLLLLIICIQGAGLDELKHDLSTEEFIAQKCKDVIVKNKREIIRANIEPNKAGSEEVADLDPDQLPTLAFVVLVSSIIPISNLSHKTFAHMLAPPEPSSFGDSGPDVSFDMSASLEHLSSSARARLATSILSSFKSGSFGSSAESKSVVQLRPLWRLLQLLCTIAERPTPFFEEPAPFVEEPAHVVVEEGERERNELEIFIALCQQLDPYLLTTIQSCDLLWKNLMLLSLFRLLAVVV
ncbi:hypothetical protein Tco_0360202 [Tanacetum coccineum]